MKKKIIKMITVLLTCATITMVPVMASAESNSDKIDKSNGITHSEVSIDNDNIKLEINNIEVKNEENNKVDEISAEKAITNPLKQFFVSQYEDSKYIYKANNLNIPRANLPYLEFEALQQGNGNMSYIAIDGKQLYTSDYKSTKTVYTTNGGVVTSWKNRVTFNKAITDNLTSGSHTVKAICFGDKYDMNAEAAITSTFTFNLVD